MVFLIFWSNISDLRQFFLFLALCDVMSGSLRPAAPAVSRAADLIFCLQGAKNKESKVNVPRHMLVLLFLLAKVVSASVIQTPATACQGLRLSF